MHPRTKQVYFLHHCARYSATRNWRQFTTRRVVPDSMQRWLKKHAAWCARMILKCAWYFISARQAEEERFSAQILDLKPMVNHNKTPRTQVQVELNTQKCNLKIWASLQSDHLLGRFHRYFHRGSPYPYGIWVWTTPHTPMPYGGIGYRWTQLQ